MKLGYLEKFKAIDTLLLIGSVEDYLLLYSSVEEFLQSGTATFELHNEDYVDAQSDARLYFSKGIVDDTLEFQLDCSRVDVLSMILGIQRNAASCHQYADLHNTEVQLLFSMGEYDDTVFS